MSTRNSRLNTDLGRGFKGAAEMRALLRRLGRIAAKRKRKKGPAPVEGRSGFLRIGGKDGARAVLVPFLNWQIGAPDRLAPKQPLPAQNRQARRAHLQEVKPKHLHSPEGQGNRRQIPEVPSIFVLAGIVSRGNQGWMYFDKTKGGYVDGREEAVR